MYILSQANVLSKCSRTRCLWQEITFKSEHFSWSLNAILLKYLAGFLKIM